MMKARKLLATALALLMLASSLASCADKGEDTDLTTPASQGETQAPASDAPEETEGEPDRASYPDTLPNDLDFGQKTLRLYYRDSTNYRLDFVATEIIGDSVNDAVFKRNGAVEDRLNIKLELVAGPSDAKEYCNGIRTMTLAGENTYDLISAYQAYTIPLSLENCFHDLTDAPYLDFDMPWWDYDYMAELQVNDDKVFFLQGDIALFMIGSMGAVFFNKELYTSLYGSADEFYDFIFDGKWTMERFGVLSEGAYYDLNGDGSANAGDIFGFAATTSKSTEHFMYDAGVEANRRDADGIPTFALDSEHTISVIEKMYNLYYENKGAYIETSDGSIGTFENMLIDGQLLFLPGWLYMAQKISADMTADYGIIPYPKYNEAQETYLSLVHDGTTIYCISSTVPDDSFPMVCAATEAFAAESYRSVVPAYYDVALKYRYSDDDQSAAMLDMIRDNITTDFFYANNYSFTAMPGLICRTLMKAKSKNFASQYKAVNKVTLIQLEDIIEKYNSMDS